MPVIARHAPLLMVGLTLAAAVMRFTDLGHESLWGDEIIAWLQSHRESPGAVIALMRASGLHPPGHNLLLYVTMRLLGDAELILRLPSALAGVLAVPVLYRLARDLFGPREGLLAAAFLTVLWAPLYYSQEARSYGLMLLFVLVLALLWVRLLRRLVAGEAASPALAVAYAAAAAFLAYLHYFGLLWVALLGLGGGLLLWRRRRALAGWLALNLVVGMGFLPWVPAMTTGYGAEVWIPVPEADTLPAFARFLFNESWSLPLLVAPLILLLALQTLADGSLWRRRAGLPAGELLIGLWFAVPVALALAISWWGPSVLSNRNLIIVAPAAYLLLARAIARQPLPAWGHLVLGGGYALLFLGHTLWAAGYYTLLQKPQFREAAAYVLAQADRTPQAVVAGYPGTMYDYYLTRGEPALRVDLPGGFVDDVAPLERLVAERDAQYIWFLAGGRQPPRPQYVTALRGAYRELAHERFFQAEVWLFERLPAAVAEPAPPVAAGTIRLRVQPPPGQRWSDPGQGFPLVNDWSADDQRFFIRKLERDGLWIQFVIRNRTDFVFNARFPVGGQTHSEPLDLVLTWEDGTAAAYIDGGLIREEAGMALDPAGWDLPVVRLGRGQVEQLEVLDYGLTAEEVADRVAADR